MSDLSSLGADTSPHDLAHPQPLYQALRDTAAAIDIGEGLDSGSGTGMVIVGRDDDVRHVLARPDIFSSGIDAVAIGQVRPLIPLQIDPPEHLQHRKLLNPIFAPRQVALLEDGTRRLVRDLVDPLVPLGRCNFHAEVAEPLPTTVFLNMLGLPVSRAKEFIELKDGIVRPPVTTSEERVAIERFLTKRWPREFPVLTELMPAATFQPSGSTLPAASADHTPPERSAAP